MKVFRYSCPNCGYSSVHELGTPEMDQTLTDVNTEFSEFKLFTCPVERRFVSVNVLDPNFSGKCPSDSAGLVQVENISKPACPQCGQRSVTVEDLKPLAPADSGSE
jgi:predicted RNA-binding Zn-ribbon protein involved in translation (DUF1610 family)